MAYQGTVLSNGGDTPFTSRLSGDTKKVAAARLTRDPNELHTDCVPFHNVNCSSEYKI